MAETNTLPEQSKKTYREIVNSHIANNTRIICALGAVLYFSWTILDWVVYPSLAPEFMKIRALVSAIVFMCFLAANWIATRNYVVWISQIAAVTSALGVLAMVHLLPDKFTSPYYQGVYVGLLVMFIMNSYYVVPNIMGGLIVLAAYPLAVYNKDFAAHFPQVLTSMFFIGTILIFVVVLTKIYSAQFLREFLKSEQLKVVVNELRKAEEFMRQLSMNDELTKLNNRRGFMVLAEEQMKLALRNKTGLMIFFADMDGLKKINDTYGHAEGDKAIQAIAEALKKSFRDSDVIARFAGDEFAMMLVNATRDSERIFITRIQQKLREQNERKDFPYHLSISVGARYFEVTPETTIDKLMEDADKNLYELKRKRKTGI